MSDSTFAERMAYALLLYYWREGVELTQSAIAKAVGMTQPGVQPWYERTEPPQNWTVHAPLAQVLGVEKGWLVQNDGEPPRPHLWSEWIKDRRAMLSGRAGKSMMPYLKRAKPPAAKKVAENDRNAGAHKKHRRTGT